MDWPRLRLSLLNARQRGTRAAQALYTRLAARLTLLALAIRRLGRRARGDWMPRIAHLGAQMRTASGSGSRSGWRRWRIRVLVPLTILSVLVASLLPPLLSLRDAFADYQQLRALGVDGYQHLLAAKDDLSSLGLAHLSDVQSLLPTAAAAPSADSAAYTDLIQHQAGTSDRVTVTVHPSPRLAAAGLKEQRFTQTVDANTPVRYGAAPAPAAPPTATQPQAGGNPLPDPAAIRHALAAATGDLRAAQQDFVSLRSRLRDPDWLLSLAESMSQSKTKLESVQQLAEVGVTVTTLGLEASDTLTPMLSRLDSGVFASTDAPLLAPADIAAIHRLLQDADSGLGDVATRLAHTDLSQLPISTSQQAEVASLAKQLPGLREKLQQISPWVDVAAWVLGVGQARSFLVQTLDRTELRPSGGFTGDYGVLSITNGRVAPFALYNINDIEYGYKSNGWIYGKHPPAAYSWWPFDNWGLRDSNLSADFPTTAKMNIQLFHNEGAGDVDGVIQFTVTLIARVLLITGPIFVPGYNETITADNLEQRIEFYQQDPRGIAIEQKLNPTDHTHSLRKRFTQLLTQLLQDKVKHLPAASLIQLAHQLVDDLRSKDLQIYVTDAHLEQTLASLDLAGIVQAPPTGQDTYLLVQANVSVAKSTPFVTVTQTDDVTLDNQGGATHRLTLHFVNNPQGPEYGYPTYRDYLRIYVPATARFTEGWGFDQMTPMCYTPPPPTTPPTPPPPQYANLPNCSSTPYFSYDRDCPDGYYAFDGEATKVLGWGDNKVPALDTLGPPTNTSSDIAGLAMRGGYVVIPQKCGARVTLRWYVPNVVHPLPHA